MYQATYEDLDLSSQKENGFDIRDHKPANLNDQAFVYYPRLRRVRDHVEQQYQETLTLGSLAEVAGLEKKYFSKYFHRTTGIRAIEWLTWVRIQHAVTVMRRQDLSVTEVAYSVGFNDLRSFERAATRHIGCSPSKLKRLVSPLIARLTAAAYLSIEWLEPVGVMVL
jgi:AraC-like DNA-binding protein